MTTAETIFQCTKCLRFFSAGNVVSVSFGDQLALSKAGGIEQFDCGREDCRPVGNPVVPALPRSAWRHGHKAAPKERCAPWSSATAPQSAGGRLPYPKDDEREFTPPSEVRHPNGDKTSLVPGLLSPGARQEQFIARGATSKTDARVRDFLMAEQNFGNWFSRKFLKDVARNDLLNNIADRLRDELVPQGLYVDNDMISESELGRATSHYRICRIESAISLSAEEKLKLMTQNAKPTNRASET